MDSNFTSVLNFLSIYNFESCFFLPASLWRNFFSERIWFLQHFNKALRILLALRAEKIFRKRVTDCRQRFRWRTGTEPSKNSRSSYRTTMDMVWKLVYGDKIFRLYKGDSIGHNIFIKNVHETAKISGIDFLNQFPNWKCVRNIMSSWRAVASIT